MDYYNLKKIPRLSAPYPPFTKKVTSKKVKLLQG